MIPLMKNFHTIQSILKHEHINNETELINLFPYYSVYFKANVYADFTPTLFQYFHTIQSILKLFFSLFILVLFFIFPYYSVYFKA